MTTISPASLTPLKSDTAGSAMFRQKGLSLIELMISIAVGLILMTGIIQLFLGSRVTFETQQAVSRIQETGRMAMEFMAQDIRMAGYRGCSRAIEPVSYIEEGASASEYYEYRFDPGREIVGKTASALGPAGGVLADYDLVPGSDVLVVRSAGEDSLNIVNYNSNNANFGAEGTVSNACLNGTTICRGDTLMVSDCQNAVVFRASNVSGGGSGQATIVHSQGNNIGPPNNIQNQSTREFSTGAELVKMSTAIFYVAESRVNPPQTSLWKKGFGDAVELVEGVENMRLSYGIDTSNNGVPNEYVPASASLNWSRVLAVRIELLVSSESDGVVEEPQPYVFAGSSVTPTDRRLRHVFVNTIAVRNRLQ